MSDPEDRQERLRKVLLDHQGSENAITSAELSRKSGIRDGAATPQTRRAIRQLIEETNLPVGACRQGYFIITSEHELREYVGYLNRRKIGITTRIEDVVSAYQDEHFQQKLREAANE